MQTTRGASLSDDDTQSPPVRHRRIGILSIVAACVLAADLISKVIVVATLSDRAPIRLLGGLLTLNETRNSGAAFGLGEGLTVLFAAVAVGVIVVILRTARRLYSTQWAVALGPAAGWGESAT